MLKPNQKNIIKFIAWALVIAILLPSMIVIGIYTFYPFKTPGDIIPNPTEEPLVYSQQDRNAFKAYLNEFLKIGLFPLGDTALNQLAGFFLTAFSRARIPAEKVLAFGQYLKDNNSQVALYIEKLLGYLEEDQSQFKLKEEVDGLTFFNELTIIVSAIMQILDACNFSVEETGRVYFEFLYQVGNVEYHNALTELGKGGFVTLYNSIYAAFILSKLDLSSGYSDNDLEQMRSAFYQVGFDYIQLYSKLGDYAIETVLGTKFLLIPEDNSEISEEEINVYNQAMQSLDGLCSFSLLVFSEFSVSISNEFYSNSAKYAEQDSSQYLILAALQGARSAKVALLSAYSNDANEKIKDQQALIDAYANAYKQSRNFIASIRGQEEYNIDHSQDIKDYLKNIYDLAENYPDITTLQDVQELSPAQQEELLAKIDLLLQIDEQVLTLPQELSGILLANILFKILDIEGFLKRLAEKELMEGLG